MRRGAAVLVTLLVLAGATDIGNASAAPRTVWLCRPGLAHDPCAADRTATVVRADGTTRTERPVRNAPRPVDCFYVYPTVSLQPGPNASLHVDPNQIKVATAQASRFSQVCRVYAPMYRQLTLSAIAGGINPTAAALAYGDVESAWRDYLAHFNHGRGVVLVGHSQGAGMLIRLVKRQVDPKPSIRRKLVAALLLGGNVSVPPGRDVGGDFAHIRACRATGQTSCVVAYSSFDHPPPADALFGRTTGRFNQGGDARPSEVLCVNPAALRGGTAAVHPYFPAHLDLGVLGGALPAGALADVAAPWATYPGRFTATCRTADGASWLQIDDAGAPGETRPALVDSLGPAWGLHLVDVNIALGDLVRLVRSQGAAWSRSH